MKEQELDTIIRLIPTATVRQTEVILGQVSVHLKLLGKKLPFNFDFSYKVK